jgi:hypothetical protein
VDQFTQTEPILSGTCVLCQRLVDVAVEILRQ